MVRRWLAVPILICAGCGASSTTSSSIESATGVTGLLPATTLFVQPTVGSGPLVLPEPIAVSEPCPDSGRVLDQRRRDGAPVREQPFGTHARSRRGLRR